MNIEDALDGDCLSVILTNIDSLAILMLRLSSKKFNILASKYSINYRSLIDDTSKSDNLKLVKLVYSLGYRYTNSQIQWISDKHITLISSNEDDNFLIGLIQNSPNNNLSFRSRILLIEKLLNRGVSMNVGLRLDLTDQYSVINDYGLFRDILLSPVNFGYVLAHRTFRALHKWLINQQGFRPDTLFGEIMVGGLMA